MSRINSILSSKFFTHNQYRLIVNKFIESKFNIYDNTEISLINLPIDYVFDPSGNFKDKICMHIRDAVNLMGMSVEF